MPYHAAVMYPNDAEIQFNRDYYMKVHMPLVESIWKKHGLISCHVVEYTKSLDGSPSMYLIATTLVFESEESLQNAQRDPDTDKLFADIPNFTNKHPITLAGVGLSA
ncbi:hypothetical protein N7448_008857 [Penicillium atrosanguineum]|uniref:EthD domain-containing protein n=1 Tax=Penicillium atrosanguineum TaxID=1132637 RepID=A0A9W9UCF6_9EURO|nr:uncharacterized protein N7443_000115 [Penicillium atrosanguineum]KAJ5128078.1 hypothetical protein N7448_008857 [Penicillium atrosanguineum]KAJ5148288.1 hypothetical protein N7526_001640 [Penicillium atrosanguineum]KAJ5313231.1 hypothetical protein N7443_000115 [Penicillium atrosanguineum]KAJ5330334.1 hypothetical protein N7476_000117 [Penicillium atrosanguineum]